MTVPTQDDPTKTKLGPRLLLHGFWCHTERKRKCFCGEQNVLSYDGFYSVGVDSYLELSFANCRLTS